MLLKHHTQSSARSLLWAFGSPALVTSAGDRRWQTDEWFSWRALELAGIMQNDRQAEQLAAFLEGEKDHRLGARFERLVEYGLTHLPGFEAVHRRLQVNHQGQTRGEFDFIVKDRESTTLEHWEVASKFYLGVPVGEELHWVGPGKRDSLRRKLGHLTRKQLQLATSDEAADTIATLESPPERVRAMLKGRLFYPLNARHEHDSLFDYSSPHGSVRLNVNAPFGFWCDLNQYLAAAPEKTFRLAKTVWLDPEPELDEELGVEEVESELDRGPLCVDVVTRDQQRQRWFIVSGGWFDDLDTEALR